MTSETVTNGVMTKIEFIHAGPLVSVQDKGRFGALSYGVAASGPMDMDAYDRAGDLLNDVGRPAGNSVVECATGRHAFRVKGTPIVAAFCGGSFNLKINNVSQNWERAHQLVDGDSVEIVPGAKGNYATIRFDREIDVPQVIGSCATNSIAHIGGYKGRSLKSGDKLALVACSPSEGAVGDRGRGVKMPSLEALAEENAQPEPIRFIWGLHADLFPLHIRKLFISEEFAISPLLDRMGVRLVDKAKVFQDRQNLSLVSDAVVPGDIQIIGDGTPVVLMRDHQPTGGYPRIGTLISSDISTFAQLRPGTRVRFSPVTIDKAHGILDDIFAKHAAKRAR